MGKGIEEQGRREGRFRSSGILTNISLDFPRYHVYVFQAHGWII